MKMPGFTAEQSVYKTVSHFQFESARSLGSEKKDNQVYMQKPNSDNTPGASCHATGGDATINVGTYNNDGWCCGPKFSNGSRTCINCDNATCADGVSPFYRPPISSSRLVFWL